MLEFSKRAVLEKTALQQAATQIEQLNALCSALSSLNDHPDMEKLRKQVQACSKSKDTLAVCEASGEDGAAENAAQLAASLASLAACVDKFENGPEQFATTLQCLWLQQEDLSVLPSLRKLLVEIMARGTQYVTVRYVCV